MSKPPCRASILFKIASCSAFCGSTRALAHASLASARPITNTAEKRPERITSSVRGVFTYRVNDAGLIANMRGYWNLDMMTFGNEE